MTIVSQINIWKRKHHSIFAPQTTDMLRISILLLTIALLLSACTESSTNETKKTVVSRSDDREKWQNPYEVLNLWGDDLVGKRIMEVGSNDGYWTFKLAKAGAYVIAADFSEARLEAIMEDAEELGLEDRIETRLITTSDPMLQPAEMDMVWAVNVYSVLPNRAEFFAKVHNGLKNDGQLVILDWLVTQTEHGPPVSERIAGKNAMDDMDKAGFYDVALRTNVLPEMWVMVAQNVPDEAFY